MTYTVHAHTLLGSFEVTIIADSIKDARAQAEHMFCGPETRIFVSHS